MLEAAFVYLPTGPVTTIDLPESFRRRTRAAQDAPVSERDHLLSMLLATNWNKTKTAEKLNWSRMTVYRKLAKYQLTQKTEEKTCLEKPDDVTSPNAA